MSDVNSTSTEQPGDNSDVLFLISVVAPLIVCCFAIFICAVGSICKTRKKLDLLETKYSFAPVADANEFTVDLTTKVDSCVEITSTPNKVPFVYVLLKSTSESSSHISLSYMFYGSKNDVRREQSFSTVCGRNAGSSSMIGLPTDVITFNVGGKRLATFRKTFPRDSPFYKWFVAGTKEVPFPVRDNEFFVDRDPKCFAIILNYFRLKSAGQLWEACLPKDPDRLALLTQEAEFFGLSQLRDQAINLLQSSRADNSTNYVHEVLARSSSFSQGFNSPLDE